MTVNAAISEARTLTGSVPAGTVSDDTLTRWLSEFDGSLAVEFFHMETWLPYDPVTDADCSLIIPFPWDGRVYVHFLEAMIFYSTGELARYENARTLFTSALDDFKKYVHRNAPIRRRKGDDHSCMIDGIIFQPTA